MLNRSYVEFVKSSRPFGWEYLEDPDNPTHYAFEEINPYWWHDLATGNRALPIYICVVYITTIFSLQHWMRSKPAFQLTLPLFLWNTSLGIFSIVAFIRSLPGLAYVLHQPNGLYDSICSKNSGNIATSFWMIMFVLSKFLELGDTIFIVLRKRKLTFLQWYHHAITMIVAWTISPYVEPITRWYAILNYGVHSLMYPYFALRTLDVKIPHSFANLITSLQLAQMIAGFSVNFFSYYFQLVGRDCYRHPTSITVLAWVYGSFLVLFGKLFYEAVIKQGRRQRDIIQANKKIE